MLYSYYSERLSSNLSDIDRVKPISRLLIAVKLISFCLFAAMAYGWYAYDSVIYPIVTLLFLIVYVAAYRLGIHYDEQLAFYRNIDRCYRNELSFLNRDFSPFDRGDRFIDPSHPFSFDLDLFGIDSFYHRINRTVTLQGASHLARLLTTLPSDKEEVIARQKALAELIEPEEWRTRFLALGTDCRINISPALDALNRNRLTARFDSSIALSLLLCSLGVMGVLVLLSATGYLSASWIMIWFLIQLGITLLYLKTLFESTESLNGFHKLFGRYRNLLSHIANRTFLAERSIEKQQSLVGLEQNAIDAVDRLSKLIGQLDSRNNMLGTILCNGFFLRDLFLIRAYNRWTKRYLPHFDAWMDCLGEFDALVSLANFGFNHPRNTMPEIDSSPESGFCFSGLYHPFLPEDKAVGNDLALSSNRFAIVTGANMAGKSTFLRSIGVNYIMAMNGLRVCASSFRAPVVALFSSMRTTDNLAKNISYFNSELLRLEQLTDFCLSHPHTFIILDEILKGTNSADKLTGARLFLTRIAQLPVTGLIATHDLELSKLEDETDRFANYCFEIELTDEVTYSYRLARGVAKNMNATYLLNRILSRIL